MEPQTFEFEMCYFNTDNFKNKQANILINTISTTRLHEFIAFDSYGNITYNTWDEPHRYPTVSMLTEFNRSKTNCLIFNVIDKRYTDLYDKVFVYYSASNTSDGSYGYVLYNTVTGKKTHKYFIDALTDELIIAITKSFHDIDFARKVEPLAKKELAIRGNVASNAEFYKQIRLNKYKELGLNIKMP